MTACKPTQAAKLFELLEQNPELLLRFQMKNHLKWFIPKCFGTIAPGTTFRDNWHIGAIAWRLEQVMRGEVKRLIITMPPRSAKSISASVAFPAFLHGHDPAKEIITVSYAQSLATKNHNDYRAILSAPWYQELFPETRVDPRKETEQEVRLTHRGTRLATSVGGVLTGRGADITIIDDPLKADDARSESQRKKVNEWYSSALVSRLNQKTEGAIVIVTQRLHVDDLVGHVTEHDPNWTVLNLPAIAVEDQEIALDQSSVYYRRKGDLLHPTREPQAVLDELRQNIGSDAFEAQYQQRPVPPDGNLFKLEWLSYYSHLPEGVLDGYIFQSWDTASKTGLENDWSVGTTWALKDGHYYLLDLVRKKLDYPSLRALMLEKAGTYAPKVILIEDTGVGMGLIADLKSESFDAVGVTPKDTKESRAHIQTPKFESGRVLFPERAPWLSKLKAELLAFPSGRHDDQVDSITQALGHEIYEGPSVITLTFGRPRTAMDDFWRRAGYWD